MIKLMRKLEDDDNKERELKAIKTASLMKEVKKVNAAAQQVKVQIVEQEKFEDQKIAQYNLDKALKEQTDYEEKVKVLVEKEHEIQRLRELQEKASDRQAEIDYLRAK